VQAVTIDSEFGNVTLPGDGEPVRSQKAIYQMLAAKAILSEHKPQVPDNLP
jgi:hypothetical protein